MRRLTASLLLFAMSFALAQTSADPLPLIRLSSFSVGAGEDLTLSASELEPNTLYDLSLTSPDGAESVEPLQADAEGNLEHTVQFDEAGRWQLGLDELNFNVPIEVQAATDPVASSETQEDSEASESTSETQEDEGTASETVDEADVSETGADEAGEASDLQEETENAFEPLVTPENGEEADETTGETETPTDTDAEATEGAQDAEAAAEDSDEAAEGTAPVVTPDPETGEATGPETDLEETDPVQTDEAEPVIPNDSTGATRRDPLESLARSLGSSGWSGVLSLLVAFLALHLVLSAKYWRPRSVNLERQRILGRSVNPLFRAMTIRYYSLTEKLVLLLLLLAASVMAALASWASGGSVANTWNGAIIGIFTNPWTGFLDLRPIGLNLFVWMFIVVLFLAVFIFTVVWLFIPRPRWVANAPRGVLYHILAVLVPGSGLADEMWGLLLMIPWALFGLDALTDLLGWGFGLGLSLFWDLVILGIIYLINLVAVIVEFMSYRRRINTLKSENPELAQEFGMVRPVR